MSRFVKYPRTPHLPASPGKTTDDITLETIALEKCSDVVVTEKLDGENTSLYADYLHSRSLTYSPHPSRDWISRFHALIRHDIPPNFRICGENLYAKHSIYYAELPTYFFVFAMFQNTCCLPWDETAEWCALLNLETVPVLYRGKWDDKAITACYTGKSVFGGEQEGYVVRNAGSFDFKDFGLNVAKFVRAGHVQTDRHWMTMRVIPNKRLRKRSQ